MVDDFPRWLIYKYDTEFSKIISLSSIYEKIADLTFIFVEILNASLFYI